MLKKKIKFNQAYALVGSGNSGAIDIQDGSGTIQFGANVSALQGTTPGVTFGIDMMGPDGNWYNVWTGANITATPTNVFELIGTIPGAAVAAILGNTIRITWALAGTATPKASFTAWIMYP